MKKSTILKHLGDNRLRYLFVGGSSVFIEYGSFLLLVGGLKAGPVVSNAISFTVGLLYTFILHNRWTFSGQHQHGIKRQFISYFSLAFVNLLATSLLIEWQVSSLHVNPLLAKIICMASVILWNYLLLNKVIFKRFDDKI